jgi:DNA-directed RNA polymerase specialized sigma24 family protein
MPTVKESYQESSSAEEDDREGRTHPDVESRPLGETWRRRRVEARLCRGVTNPDTAARESEADQLLRQAGAFNRSTGILTGRGLREIAARETSLDAVSESVEIDLGSVDLWDEMDALAAWCGLTPLQKAALAMWRLGEYTHEEIARELGCTRRNVQRLLGRALRNVRRGVREFPGTPRALFWEEVRYKSRMIYRKPSHGWRSAATGKETEKGDRV